MKFTNLNQADMVCADNLIKVIAQGKYEFSGIEAMAFVKTCQWFNFVYDEMKKSYEVQQAAAKGKAASKQPEKPKKKRKASKKAKK